MTPTNAKPLILLDLNYTLVANSKATFNPRNFTYDVEREVYREWLIDLIRDHHVILITARPKQYEGATIASIRSKTGWVPHEWHFNRPFVKAPLWKEEVITQRVFPRFGTPEEMAYLALESNKDTTAMYTRYGIPAHRQEAVFNNPALVTLISRPHTQP